MRQPLQENVRVPCYATFDASGVAVAALSVGWGPAFRVRQISIDNSFQSPITNARTFIGGVNGTLVSQSYLGNGDTDSEPNVLLRAGDSLTCEWTGGTPGGRATMWVVYDQVPG